MSIDAKQPAMAGADVEARREWRQMEVSKAVQMLGSLVSAVDQPFNVPGHMLKVTDVSRNPAVDATYVVTDVYQHRVNRDEEPHTIQETFAISAGRTAVTGHSKVDLTSFDETEELYVKLGIQRAAKGLNEADEGRFALARDEQAKLRAERDGIPHAELSDAEQAMNATHLNTVLTIVHNAVVKSQRAAYPAFAPV